MTHQTRVLSLFQILSAALLFNTLALTGCAEGEPQHKDALFVRQTKPVQESQPKQAARLIDLDEGNSKPYHDWKFVILHHTASSSGSVESIDEQHRQRVDSSGTPWKGIGYHFLIGNGQGMRDGEVRPTFRWQQQISGAHAGVRQYNEFGIGVCLVGNFEQAGPTSAQLDAVSRLISELREQFGIQSDQILKHGDLKATACPGRHFPFQEIVSRPPAGQPVAQGTSYFRSDAVEPGHTEEINNVVSVLRATQGARFSQQRASGGTNAGKLSPPQ